MWPSTVGCILTLALAIIAAPLATNAQRPSKVPRIGFLCAMSGPSLHTAGFLQGLRELGYIAGENIEIEYRFMAGGSPRLCLPDEMTERFRDAAASLVRQQVDVIVVASTPAIGPAKDATTAIPIVMAQSDDPIGSGLVANLARPGGNITGLTTLAPELSGKRLELLKEALPGLSRVAVLANPTNPASVLMLRETQVAAQALDVQLQILEVRSPNDFTPAFAAIQRERAEALIVLPDLMLFDHIPLLTRLAANSQLPSMYESKEFAQAGGLMSYGPNIEDMFRRAATYVAKLLKGAKPGDLPVEQPMTFELVINLKTAKALALAIPPSLLLQADEVIH